MHLGFAFHVLFTLKGEFCCFNPAHSEIGCHIDEQMFSDVMPEPFLFRGSAGIGPIKRPDRVSN